MKKYFVTGLAILLPVALTIAIVVFIFNLLTGPFLGLVTAVFERYQLFEHGFLFLNASEIQNLIAKLLILISLFLICVGLGFIARWFFFHTILKFAEYIVQRIPLVRSIYNTCQDVIKTIFTSKTNSFKQVVLIKFPHTHSYSIGLITRENIPGLEGTPFENAVSVFIPTTPNPTSGFLVMYKPDDLVYLNMKVEDAFKYIISCGVISPLFQQLSKEDYLLKNSFLEKQNDHSDQKG